MSVEPAIELENVSKRFALDGFGTQSILETVVTAVSRSRAEQPRQKELWALQDVSFRVLPGHSLGLIGRNGSGKSTALKLLSRILRPTTGKLTVRGRVSALLELGAGFHPDLTGQENIFLNASVLGLSREDVAKHYDSIVEFSELGDFIHMPVKHYSSGMYMRLGFSVAIHVNPDVLIVDEILAVGDQAFQTKCIDKIYELKNRGTTIVLVSHNLDMMRRICSHLVWLENGRVRESGQTETVAAAYRAASMGQTGSQMTSGGNSFRRWGGREMEITAVSFLNDADEPITVFHTDDKLTVEISYVAHQPIREPEIGLAIFHQDGTHISGPNTRRDLVTLGTVAGSGKIRYEIERLPLLPARYEVTVAIHDSRLSRAYDYHEKAYSFRVNPSSDEKEVADGIISLGAMWKQPIEEKPA